ncbi:hypothetical protein COO60DRAFT_1546809 [Scenedesmus sp. NREL 46B-D3]|nr:hypothetical protein COO60DRAFT_1546809 [Scenedesmus sp. NREL 46B-D3]
MVVAVGVVVVWVGGSVLVYAHAIQHARTCEDVLCAFSMYIYSMNQCVATHCSMHVRLVFLASTVAAKQTAGFVCVSTT